MMNKEIIVICIEDGKKRSKNIDRQAMLDVFNGLIQGFSGDNEISKKLVEIIPTAESFTIDKDINSTQDVPFILVQTGEETKVIKILRYHKIVWTILNKYCEE